MDKNRFLPQPFQSYHSKLPLYEAVWYTESVVKPQISKWHNWIFNYGSDKRSNLYSCDNPIIRIRISGSAHAGQLLWNTTYIRAAFDPGRKEKSLYYTYSTACCRHECVSNSPPCIVRPILQHIHVINTSRQLWSGLVVQSSRLRKRCDETNLVTIKSFHETQIEIKIRHPQFFKHGAILCCHLQWVLPALSYRLQQTVTYFYTSNSMYPIYDKVSFQKYVRFRRFQMSQDLIAQSV
jgi:hypothetical protein